MIKVFKSFVLLSLFLAVHFQVCAQAIERELDSLSALVKKAPEDPLKVTLLIECAERAKEPLNYIYPALAIARKIKSRPALAEVYDCLADYYITNTINADSCFYYNTKCLTIAKEINNNVRIGARYESLSYLYRSYYKDQVKGRQFIDTALLYLRKPAYNSYEEKNRAFVLAKALSGLTEYLIDKKQFQKVEETIREVYGLQEKFHLGAYIYLACATNLGNTYVLTHKHDSAVAIFNRVLDKARLSDNKVWIAYAHYLLAYAYSGHKDYNIAIEYAKKGVAFAIANNITKEASDNYNGLIEIYTDKKDFEKALYYTNVERRFSDSLKTLTEGDIKMRFEKNLKAEKDQLQIELLKKDKDLEQEKTERQKMYTFISIAVVLLLIVFAFFMINRFRITNAQKKIIEHQKELVELKQKEIIDSIQYAKRIQTALMSNEKYIDKSLNRLNKS